MTKKLSAQAFKSFVAALEPDRRGEVEAMRKIILKHLPAGYEEAASGKMLVYQVPLESFRDTYNKKPLWYAALVSEKSYLSLHLMPVYGSQQRLDRLKAGFSTAGKKLNMGKACIRFHKVEDLAIDSVAEVIRAVQMDEWIAFAKTAWGKRS